MRWHARWYVPGIGRFLSKDPVESLLGSPGGMNLYAYAGDSPKTFADPTGLCRENGNWFLDGAASLLMFPYSVYHWFGDANDQQRYAMGAALLTAFVIGLAIGLSCFEGCWLAPLMAEELAVQATLIVAAFTVTAAASAAGIVFMAGMYIQGRTADRRDVQLAFILGAIAGGAGFRFGARFGSRLANEARLTKPVGSAKPDVETLRSSANKPMNAQGGTPAGRALAKHSGRPNSWLYGKGQEGNHALNAEAARPLIDDILERGTPAYYYRPPYGDVVDYTYPDGTGARWGMDGRFIGFLD